MNINKDKVIQISQAIESAENILIISHAKPDGDTLGAAFALTNYLLTLSHSDAKPNKNITNFCLDEATEMFSFVPNIYRLSTDHLVFTKKYDLVIVVDSGSLAYAGVDKLITALEPGFTLINIDHHASNTSYADINLVITEAASCTEVLFYLFNALKIKFTKDIATCLLCGLVTDTGGFVNPATQYHTLEAASCLVKHGANLWQILQNTNYRQNINNLKLWGIAFSRLKKIAKYDLVYTFLKQEDFVNCQADESSTEGISNFLHILKEAKIILVLKETSDGRIKGSMRTAEDNIDLAKFCQALGGGGHKKAAGFSLPGRLVYDKNTLKIV